MTRHTVFVTGGTGYIGRPLIERLAARGHGVRALVRPGSARRLPAGVEPVLGDALDARTFADGVAPADTLVHLVDTPRPSPSKAAERRAVELASLAASVQAAGRAGVRHFVYVSVAQPAPVMRAYVEARAEGERRLRASGIPRLCDGARRLGLITRGEMLRALVDAVERSAVGTRIVEVPAIRGGGGRAPAAEARLVTS